MKSMSLDGRGRSSSPEAWLIRSLRWILALTFLLFATTKVVSGYRSPSDLPYWLWFAAILAESWIGMQLMSGRVSLGSRLAIAFFLLASVWTWTSSSVHGCGCLGNLATLDRSGRIMILAVGGFVSVMLHRLCCKTTIRGTLDGRIGQSL